MAKAGTGMVWSPRSNISLYGDTARVTVASRLGVNIALGTDWLPSGSRTSCASSRARDSFNKTYLGGYFTDAGAVGDGHAERGEGRRRWTRGSACSRTGMVADISVFAPQAAMTPFRAVIDAQPQDVALVMRGGRDALRRRQLVTGSPRLATSCDAITVCCTEQARLPDERNRHDLHDALDRGAARCTRCSRAARADERADVHADRGRLRSPARRSTPARPRRPTATATASPTRGTTARRCATRSGRWTTASQPDADGDGMGDVCDPCPLDKTNNCN